MSQQPALTQARYRNRLEAGVGERLRSAGVSFDYEKLKVPFDVPQRRAHYLTDFNVGNIVIETKGWFGRQGAKERQKYALVKEQHPELDIRFIFSNAEKPIYKGSPTTYGDWATFHGFKWSTKGIVPDGWIKDMKKEAKKCRT